jgi:diguanylate cyclase (GGDEF)-like protein
LAYILEQIKRTREDAVFCLVDIDNFKSVNDTYGHLVGDQVLIKVATTLQENIRQSDLIARWGGEEFVIVLYPTTFSSARSILEMLRKKIQETFEVYSWKLTCSFGATVLMYDSNMDLVFKQADEALYEAKANGKNCVHFSIDIEG